jgi:hypothetical protein
MSNALPAAWRAIEPERAACSPPSPSTAGATSSSPCSRPCQLAQRGENALDFPNPFGFAIREKLGLTFRQERAPHDDHHHYWV